jgi:hypothetical protein
MPLNQHYCSFRSLDRVQPTVEILDFLAIFSGICLIAWLWLSKLAVTPIAEQ